MAGIHTHQLAVRFGDCDPAGVVYFPRFFDWFHQAMESWFDVCLGVPYAEVLQHHGFPAVRTEAQFRRPCRMGEAIGVELRVGVLGRSSFRLDYRVIGPNGDERATGATTCAMIGVDPGARDHFKAVSIPGDLRERIERFGVSPTV